VEMPNPGEAAAAITALHHKKIGDGKIRVKEANPKFGPEYFASDQAQKEFEAEKKAAPVRVGRPMPLRTERSNRPAERPKRQFSRYPMREGGPSDFKPRESSYGPSGSGERPSRPYTPRGERSYGPPRDGARPSRPYTPRGERSYGPPREGARPSRPYTPGGGRSYGSSGSGERPSRPYTPRGERSYGPPREGARPSRPYTPRGERSYGSSSSSSRPGGRPYYPPREGGRSEYKPRGERTFGPSSSSSRPSRPYSPRGERSYGPPSGDRPNRPYTPRSGSSFGQRGTGSPYGRPASAPRDGARPEYKPRGERSYGSGDRNSRPPSRYPSRGGSRFSPRGKR
jgi:hypothetical protein